MLCWKSPILGHNVSFWSLENDLESPQNPLFFYDVEIYSEPLCTVYTVVGTYIVKYIDCYADQKMYKIWVFKKNTFQFLRGSGIHSSIIPTTLEYLL